MMKAQRRRGNDAVNCANTADIESKNGLARKAGLGAKFDDQIAFMIFSRLLRAESIPGRGSRDNRLLTKPVESREGETEDGVGQIGKPRP
jgi:hypothetical protein